MDKEERKKADWSRIRAKNSQATVGDSTRQKATSTQRSWRHRPGHSPGAPGRRTKATAPNSQNTPRASLIFFSARDMTIGNVLVRNHQVLAKACLGGGFAYGFLYTNSTGSSPIRDAAQATGASDHPPASRSLRVSSFPGAYRLFKPSRAPTRALSGRA